MDDDTIHNPGRFAYEGLQRAFHEKARLGIMTCLVSEPDGLAFADLKQRFGQSSPKLPVLWGVQRGLLQLLLPLLRFLQSLLAAGVGLLQGLRFRRVDGSRIGHGRIEKEPEEIIAEIVKLPLVLIRPPVLHLRVDARLPGDAGSEG